MQWVVSLNLPIRNEILESIKQYNTISNLHIKKALYRKIRKQIPNFPSALIQCTRDNAIEMLKGNEYKKKTTKELFSWRFKGEINNFIAYSDYTIMKANKIKGIKRKYAYLRQKLQATGTCSAKRKLKRLGMVS